MLGKNDLREDHLREVVAVVAIDNLDVVSIPNQLGYALERYVPTRARVVELAIRVLLDKVCFRGCRHGRAILMRSVMCSRRAYRVNGG